MDEKEFKRNMTAAKTFQGLSTDPLEAEFWTGYQRGLRRHYHGEKFGSAGEHNVWSALFDDPDPIRKMRGLGYRIGFAGQVIKDAMKVYTLREYRSEIGRKGGSVSSERKTAAVRLNAKRGGRGKKGEKINGINTKD